MKRILQLMFLGTGIGILFSSCSMFSYTAHTAKTLAIENEVRQMPLVVDLHVDSTRWERDTAWENVLFKKHASVKNQMDYLVASILEESGADVLVEPKVSLDARMGWIRSRYDMKVMGYPARYVNFRPATMQDMRLLGMDTLDCRRDYPQVVINGAPGSWYDGRSANTRTGFGAKVRQAFSKPGSYAGDRQPVNRQKKERNPEIVRKKYEGRFEVRAAYSFYDAYTRNSYGDIDEVYEVVPVMAYTTHGAYVGEKRNVFLGAGVGFGGDVAFQDADFWLPIYFDARFNFCSRKFSPFVEVKVGPSVRWGHIFGRRDVACTFFYEANLGVSLGRYLDVSITHMGTVAGHWGDGEMLPCDLGLKLGVRW